MDEALGYHVTCARGSITKSCLPSTANERQKCVSYETKNLAIADKNALIPQGVCTLQPPSSTPMKLIPPTRRGISILLFCTVLFSPFVTCWGRRVSQDHPSCKDLLQWLIIKWLICCSQIIVIVIAINIIICCDCCVLLFLESGYFEYCSFVDDFSV